MTVDWSVVERDDDGDWRVRYNDVPNEIPVFNTHLTEGEWRDIATFAGAVATAMRGEEIDRQMRDGRLKDFVADKVSPFVDAPYTLAGIAVDAVREFEEANPVD